MYYMRAETVMLLIKHEADVTAQDETKSTPLHLASSVGSTEVVRLLVEHGADVTAQDVHHMTPLHLASSWVSAECMQLLIQYGLKLADRMDSQENCTRKRPKTMQIQCSY